MLVDLLALLFWIVMLLVIVVGSLALVFMVGGPILGLACIIGFGLMMASRL